MPTDKDSNDINKEIQMFQWILMPMASLIRLDQDPIRLRLVNLFVWPQNTVASWLVPQTFIVESVRSSIEVVQLINFTPASAAI